MRRYASRLENEEGGMQPGTRADMAIFSKNFIELLAAQTAQGEIVMTLVGGRIVSRAGIH